jgi:hypothetical protein
MFMTARGKVALVMNIAGLSQSQAGPNYTPINNDYIYQIHIDNDGDAREDITFQFVTGYRYANNGRGIEIAVPQGVNVPLPLAHIVGVHFNTTTGVTVGLNVEEYYRVRVLSGDDYSSAIEAGPFASTASFGETVTEFTKAFDNAGTKSFGENATQDGSTDKYDEYVREAAIYTRVNIPGCSDQARMFVGPRRESFGIALGEVFDAINIDPAPVFELDVRVINVNGTAFNGTTANSTAFDATGTAFDGNTLDQMSVISFVIEIAPQCLRSVVHGGVLGGWASVRTLEHRTSGGSSEQQHFAGQQTTRLGNPLVNELLIGTTFKNEWNSRQPSGDERFNAFLLNPVIPAYIQLLFGAAGVSAPKFERVDLLAILHQGIPGLNRPNNDATRVADFNKRAGRNSKQIQQKQDAQTSSPSTVFADMLRLNVTAGAYKKCAKQNSLGVLGKDTAGYPNGRRLGDDVVDITLRAAMGALCTNAASAAQFCGGRNNIAPSGSLHYTDQAPVRACMFHCAETSPKRDDFPFLNTPIPGNKLFHTGTQYTVSQFLRYCTGTGNESFVQ